MSLDADHEERLRAALWYSIGRFVDDECQRLHATATPQFIAAMTELVRTQIVNVSKDLETFARHAGRTTVTTDDVLLLARRNEGLEEMMKEYVEDVKARDRMAAEGGSSSRVAPVGSSRQGRGTGGGTATRGKSTRGRGRGRGRGKS